MGKVIYLDEFLKDESIMVGVFDVAKYILGKDLPNMTHKKLQKLCYYVQAWSLAVIGSRLIDCEFQAWIHGPVCKELYDVYKQNREEITKRGNVNNIGTDECEFIDVVLDLYGEFTGDNLELLTHSEKPWKEARRGLRYWESSTNIINDDTMKLYYLDELKNSIGG